MKIIIIYSSNTGNTKKIAASINRAIKEAEMIAAEDIINEWKSADVIFLGGWIDRGNFDYQTRALLKQIEGKKIAIFSTLGAYVPSNHASLVLKKLEEQVKEKNVYLGGYICQGKVSPEFVEKMKKMFPANHSHAITPAWVKMLQDGEKHPDKEDCQAAKVFAQNIYENIERN